MWRLVSGGALVAAIIASLFLIRVDACPQPMNILEYLRTYGLRIFGSPLRVTFLGASTLLFEDASQAILIDGFFTRPVAPAFRRPQMSSRPTKRRSTLHSRRHRSRPRLCRACSTLSEWW